MTGASGLAARLRPEGDCLVFDGWRNAGGYGLVKTGNRTRVAHRIAWELAKGPIPEGLVVMHSCDNPPCCNPAHLSLGTIADNNADRHAKGRTVIPADPGAHQRNKTRCPQGHPYSGENTYVMPNGSRACRTCRAAATRRYNAKRRAA